MSRKQLQPSTELGGFLKRWRDNNRLTIEEAAERIGVVKSTWSLLERGKRAASFETLMAISETTGVPIHDLARMAGHSVHLSASAEERARRVAAVGEAIPAIGAVLDLLPELYPHEADTLLSVAEGLIRNRRAVPK